ncbi:hypothetical protein Sros01_43060 [Streptomyces roseochromogenus]|nr:hypothetical protein Sros01_43060 [Streptomyces roseochromogenus]
MLRWARHVGVVPDPDLSGFAWSRSAVEAMDAEAVRAAMPREAISAHEAANRIAAALGTSSEPGEPPAVSSYAVERLITLGPLIDLSGHRRYSSLNPDQIDQVAAREGLAEPPDRKAPRAGRSPRGRGLRPGRGGRPGRRAGGAWSCTLWKRSGWRTSPTGPRTTSPSGSAAGSPSPRSLAMEPEILVLDEPSSSLDPASRRELANILRSLDVAALMVTHDQPYALELCPRSVILSEGVIAADGPTGRRADGPTGRRAGSFVADEESWPGIAWSCRSASCRAPPPDFGPTGWMCRWFVPGCSVRRRSRGYERNRTESDGSSPSGRSRTSTSGVA